MSSALPCVLELDAKMIQHWTQETKAVDDAALFFWATLPAYDTVVLTSNDSTMTELIAWVARHKTCILPSVIRVVVTKYEYRQRVSTDTSIKALRNMLPNVTQLAVQRDATVCKGCYYSLCEIWRLQRISITSCHYTDFSDVCRTAYADALQCLSISIASSTHRSFIGKARAEELKVTVKQLASKKTLQYATIPLYAVLQHNPQFKNQIDYAKTLSLWEDLLDACMACPQLTILCLDIPEHMDYVHKAGSNRQVLSRLVTKSIVFYRPKQLQRVYVRHIPSDYNVCGVSLRLLWDKNKPQQHVLDACGCQMCVPDTWSRLCTAILTTIVPAWMRANRRHVFRDSIHSPELLKTIASMVGASATATDQMNLCCDTDPKHIHSYHSCGTDPVFEQSITALPAMCSRWLSSAFVRSFT